MDEIKKNETSGEIVRDTTFDLTALKEDAIREQQEKKKAEAQQENNNGISYEGPGLVVNNGDLKEIEDPKPEYTGITPSTQSAIDSYLKEYDEEIEAVAAEVESIKAEKGITDEDAEMEEGMDADSIEERKRFLDEYNEAVVVIDKTNYGKVIDFTDEEREKLRRAKSIKLEEVETVSLETIKTKKMKKKGDIGKILGRMSDMNITNIVLPFSGYTAQIKGLSALELVSFVDGTDNKLLDAQAKWQLIHSKIVNTSIGKMSFNDFLLNTAMQDYNTLIYGLLCSTYPEEDKMPMTCKQCGCDFEHKYTIQSLLRAEKMDDKLKDEFMHIVDSSYSEETARKAHEESLLYSVVRLKLPVTGYIIEIYCQSVYDLINKSIKELDDQDPKYATASILSTAVKTFYVPDTEADDGSYYEIDSADDITKILYSLPDTDLNIIQKKAEELYDGMVMEYGFMDIKCPNCGCYIPSKSTRLDHILFYKYRQVSSTLNA